MSEGRVMDMEFWRGRKVFVTGHTGFKGSWLCEILLWAGAEVTGYSLKSHRLFEILELEGKLRHVIGDMRVLRNLEDAYNYAGPEIVFHLAAQPIVLESYKNPVETYETNVIGTVNLLECVRRHGMAKCVLNVTTDKVYKVSENVKGHREDEPLNGFDPYSNSKSCSELVTSAYSGAFESTNRGGTPASVSGSGALFRTGNGNRRMPRILTRSCKRFTPGGRNGRPFGLDEEIARGSRPLLSSGTNWRICAS